MIKHPYYTDGVLYRAPDYCFYDEAGGRTTRRMANLLGCVDKIGLPIATTNNDTVIVAYPDSTTEELTNEYFAINRKQTAAGIRHRGVPHNIVKNTLTLLCRAQGLLVNTEHMRINSSFLILRPANKRMAATDVLGSAKKVVKGTNYPALVILHNHVIAAFNPADGITVEEKADRLARAGLLRLSR